MRTVLWCFRHEMRAAIRYRDSHPDEGIVIVDGTRLDLDRDYEPADRVLAGAYCWGRVQKLYGDDVTVEEVWLAPEYRHKVEATDDGYALLEERDKQWVQVGETQPTEEDAWAILDEKELGL